MDQRVAIVTGASSGIGMQIAKNLYRNGMEVYALARRVYAMNELDDLGIHTMHLDVVDHDEIDRVVSEIVAKTGRIDVLVNNAGIGSFGSVEEVTLTEGEYEFKVNVFGLVKMIQAVLPIMRKQHSGRIINMSSMAGKIGNMLLGSWYIGSKFAIEGMSDSLRQELKPFGIDVAVVEPGAIQSEWKDGAMDRMMDASGTGPYANLARRSAAFFAVSYKFASAPRVVARAVDRAVFSRRPKIRYAIGTGAKPAMLMKHFLPDKCLDAFFEALNKYAQQMVNRETGQNR
ncbi:oxidoreductase [Lentilactobacillus parakefiri]|uniref:Short-chain dehydrogenase/reductase n=1 Tax=Lentilactobacillus parakefiri TaxID=152332 RepID=A0A269Y3E2_9LACO|nr:oxidoreductase [Lentilactobacillus parakefiri]PAK79930.1 short-chain dehydrogenase/reductase [Lentilactobacillus parakefiri]